MNKDKLVIEFISALSNFSNNELIDLAQLLQSSPSRKAIIGLLRNTVEIRNSRSNKRSNLSKNIRNKNSHFIDANDYEQQSSQQDLSQEIYDIDSVKKMFFEYLSDKSTYPGTKDVIKTLNSSFNCHLKYETFQKRGRRDALMSCWAQLLDLSTKERSNLLKLFFNSHSTNDNMSNAYRELFKILTRDE